MVKFTFLILFAILFLSCGKSTHEKSTIEKIQGTWTNKTHSDKMTITSQNINIVFFDDGANANFNYSVLQDTTNFLLLDMMQVISHNTRIARFYLREKNILVVKYPDLEQIYYRPDDDIFIKQDYKFLQDIHKVSDSTQNYLNSMYNGFFEHLKSEGYSIKNYNHNRTMASGTAYIPSLNKDIIMEICKEMIVKYKDKEFDIIYLSFIDKELSDEELKDTDKRNSNANEIIIVIEVKDYSFYSINHKTFEQRIAWP